MSGLIPFVIQKTAAGERSFDIFSRLLQDRIIFINGAISTEMSHTIVAQMLFLEAEDPDKDIHLYVNSPGGEVTAGLAILDTMDFIRCDISTIAQGQCCSMASLLASSGAKGKRYILPHARHMIHQVSSGTQGTAIDMKIQLEETLKLNASLIEIYVKHTGKSYNQLENDMSRDKFMTAEEAIEYGLADQVISKRKN